MATPSSILTYSLIACLCFSRALLAHDDRKPYIVYMGSLPKEPTYIPTSHHKNILESVLNPRVSIAEVIIQSYMHSFNGFAANLTEKEMQKLKRSKNVVSVLPDRKLQLQTTRSWDFTGLTESVKHNNAVESDIIIGVLDTGVWPESKSFSDEGFGPIPKKWKGQCAYSFPCNKKLIGARSLISAKPPRDVLGHGSHTASTAAGNSVVGVSFYGVAEGTARGGVPSSRISAYQVCDISGCMSSAILAGFDNAIKDGVDIITISIGFADPINFVDDPIAIGAFHAFDKGILTVHAAGNSGDDPGTTSSVAPWVFTIAASSTDRLILSNTHLGNGQTFRGYSINSNSLKPGNYPLVYGKDASSTCDPSEATMCSSGCLEDKLVKGKIVICDDPSGLNEAARAGALAAIYPTTGINISYVNSLISSGLAYVDYAHVRSYYGRTKSPVGSIQKTIAINDTSAPTVAIFSSRGPNRIASDILKPDISAPGVDILAAYSPEASGSTYVNDTRSFNYNIISGTSMSCPHVAGASAYVKSFNPTWSPSAIKSALITTARVMSPTNNPDAEFAYGAGHINPVLALNPGLVYDSNSDDYINFLCRFGYGVDTIRLIVGRNVTCPPKSNNKTKTSPLDLNYPTLSAQVSGLDFNITFNRTVTNVGNTVSTYKATFAPASTLKVSVVPSVLEFKSVNESLSFSVTIAGKDSRGTTPQSLALIWSDGVHVVRSPIVLYTSSSL